MKITKRQLRRLIKETILKEGLDEAFAPTERDQERYSLDWKGQPQGDHPLAQGDDGEEVNAGELGFRDAMDGNPEKLDAELAALGYDHPDDIRAYEDGFEQGIYEKGFYR